MISGDVGRRNGSVYYTMLCSYVMKRKWSFCFAFVVLLSVCHVYNNLFIPLKFAVRTNQPWIIEEL